MKAYEVNFDGLVGPTHNYAGLAYGNLASMAHALTVSNPRAAVLQGLEKMKLLADLGLKQAVLPPHERPNLAMLRRLGFRGGDVRVLETAAEEAPFLIAAAYSASGMWAANAATVSPGADTKDGRVHFTPANLVSHFHRSMETDFAGAVLKAIFTDQTVFAHHPPLPATLQLSDEGAANHTRLCTEYGGKGFELFTYGKRGFATSEGGPGIYPARQSMEASAAIARLHGLHGERTAFARQNPVAVDAGVFHNDVISVGNRNVFLYHSLAFHAGDAVIADLKQRFSEECRGDLILIEVADEKVPIADSVSSYLFNSQLVTLPNGDMCLIAPAESQENPYTSVLLEDLVSGDNPIKEVRSVDVRQSMKNGGGPACLRLRVVLTEAELALAHAGVFLTDQLYEELCGWAGRNYRDRFDASDFVDPQVPEESRSALDELTQLLGLGSIYSFQREGAGL